MPSTGFLKWRCPVRIEAVLPQNHLVSTISPKIIRINQEREFFAKNKIGPENVHFGNNLNLNVKSVRKKAKPRKASRKSTQTRPSKDLLIHPREVVTKRENVNTLSHQEPAHKNYANNVNDYSNQSFVQSNGYLSQYSGVTNDANSNREGISERPSIFLPGNEGNKDPLDVKQNIQLDNVDAEYDLTNPQVSYSYETATKRSPVQSSRVQKGGTYDNQGVDDRECRRNKQACEGTTPGLTK